MKGNLSEHTLKMVGAVGDDEENEENRQFHSELVLGMMRALYELTAYQMAYPWRIVLALDGRKLQLLLESMAKA